MHYKTRHGVVWNLVFASKLHMANQIYNWDGNSQFLCLLKGVDVKGGRWSLISNVTAHQYHKEFILESNRNLPDGNFQKCVDISSHFKCHFSKITGIDLGNEKLASKSLILSSFLISLENFTSGKPMLLLCFPITNIVGFGLKMAICFNLVAEATIGRCPNESCYLKWLSQLHHVIEYCKDMTYI